MADVLIGAMGRTVSRSESYVKVSGPAGSLGLWTGRGGLPQERIDKFVRRHEGRAGEASARVVLQLIRQTITKRSGATARTFGISFVDLGAVKEWRVGSSADNAIRLNDGTGIYGPRHRGIRPTHAAYLKWPNRGGGHFRLNDQPRTRGGAPDPRARYRYAKVVRGQRAQHYLERAAREARPLVIRIHKNAARAAALELRTGARL